MIRKSHFCSTEMIFLLKIRAKMSNLGEKSTFLRYKNDFFAV